VTVDRRRSAAVDRLSHSRLDHFPGPSLMKRTIFAASAVACALALQACASSQPVEHYGFVARLGRDTVSVESVTRQGDRVTIDGVDRFPRVRTRHTEIQLNDDRSVRRLTMDIHTPSEPEKQRDRHVEADVTADSVHITKRDGTGTVRRDFGARGATVVAHVPQMYSLYELYFEAARRHVSTSRGDDTVHLRQLYVDREFDRFPLGGATVRLLPDGKAEIWHDWLSGVGEARLDSTGQLLSYSGARSTYKVDVTRIDDAPDVKAIGVRFAAAEAASGGPKQLSVRDTVTGSISGATFTIDYGRPLARGRVLLGSILPYDRVWRTGANAATQFTTSAPITLAGIQVPAGKYTLWTVPRKSGAADLVVNEQSGQWGTDYDEKRDLAMAPMRADTLSTPVEEFTISIVPDGEGRGSLVMEWGTFRWTAPIVVTRGGTATR
jgi:hypothetical protein